MWPGWFWHQQSSATEFDHSQMGLVSTICLLLLFALAMISTFFWLVCKSYGANAFPSSGVCISRRLYRTNFISCMILASLSACKRSRRHNSLLNLQIAFSASDDTITFAVTRSRNSSFHRRWHDLKYFKDTSQVWTDIIWWTVGSIKSTLIPTSRRALPDCLSQRNGLKDATFIQSTIFEPPK